jgi:hypothetical protein
MASALIGRHREYEAVVRAIGRSRLVFVSGPAGVGKSAIARAVAAAADPSAPVLYVPHARTCAGAAAGIAAALAAPGPAVLRTRAELRFLRRGAAARSAEILRRRTGRERAVIFDHVDNPGPRLDTLVDLWRERTTVVLIARSEEALGRLHRHLYDCERVRVDPLDSAAGAAFVDEVALRFGIEPPPRGEAIRLVRQADGIPGLLHATLQLAARRRHAGAPLAALLRRVRLEALGRERDAIIRLRIVQSRRSGAC